MFLRFCIAFLTMLACEITLFFVIKFKCIYYICNQVMSVK